MPNINSILLRREGSYLTATATDRYVAGKVRIQDDLGIVSPPPDGWRFPIALADAKVTLRDARAAVKSGAVMPRRRFRPAGPSGAGVLRNMLTEDVIYAYGLVNPTARFDERYPVVDYLIRQAFDAERDKMCLDHGLNLVKVAQFTEATRQLWRDGGGYPTFTRTVSDHQMPTYVMKFGEEMVGIVMPTRLGGGAPSSLDISSWGDML